MDSRHFNRRRRARYAAHQHHIREVQRRAVARVETEAVEAHEPQHSYGCLRCFVARQEARRGQGAES